MGQAINRNRRLLSSQNISSKNTIWGGHLKISNTNPNVTPMVWNGIGPDGNIDVNNVQNVHNISPESILPPLPITTDWMTHMTYLPMDRVDPAKLDDYYINNAIKGNKTFYNLTKGRLYKLCMHPVSSRIYWQRMYTPGYDMMFSPVVGTPSDYDNGDCLLFTNAFKISDQSYNIIKYNTLTMEITVLHTWFIEAARVNDSISIIKRVDESINTSVRRYNGKFDFYNIPSYDNEGIAITNDQYFTNYIKDKNNSIRLFTWCDYLRDGKYAILKYGDGTSYELNVGTATVYDTNNSLLKYDIYTNTLTTIQSSIPNLSNHGRPKFINTFTSTRDTLILLFEEAGDICSVNTDYRLSTTDICYSELFFRNDLEEIKKYAACLSLVNHRMVFGKDLYGVSNIKNKTERISKTYSNLNHLTKFNNPYIEYYNYTSTYVREHAPWIRFYSVNLLTNIVTQDTRERPNENVNRTKIAMIPGLSGRFNSTYCFGVLNGSVYPLYDTSYRLENPCYVTDSITISANGYTYDSTSSISYYSMDNASYAWSANQLFLSNEIKYNSYNNIETNTNPAILLHKANLFQYPHSSLRYNVDGTVISTSIPCFTSFMLNSGNVLYTFCGTTYSRPSMTKNYAAFKDPVGSRKWNCLYISQTYYEQTSIDYWSNYDTIAEKNKYIGIYDWKQKYNLYGETKYRDYLSEFRVPLLNRSSPSYMAITTSGTIQPN